MSGAVGGAPADVVFTFSFDSWGDAVRRGMHRPPERLVMTMLDHPHVRRLLVANPYRSAPIRLARTLLGQGEPSFPATADHGLVTPLRLRRQDVTDVPALAESYLHYDRALARAAADRGLEDPVVITTNPMVAAYCPAPWARRVVFYGRDDWSELPARRPWWPAYRASYREIRANGRAVVAVSPQIVERIAPTGPSLVAPNGIDPQEWLGPPPPPPAWATAGRGPRAVYVGMLDTRIDVEGLLHVANQHPQLQIHLVGSMGDPRYLEPLTRLPQVHVQGHVGRTEIVGLLRSADVCLIAHRRTRLTEAMSPLKLYEYLAAGAPVLTPSFGPVRGISDRVLLTEDVSGFAEALPRALALGRAPEAEREAFVVANSWRARHDEMLAFCLGPA